MHIRFCLPLMLLAALACHAQTRIDPSQIVDWRQVQPLVGQQVPGKVSWSQIAVAPLIIEPLRARVQVDGQTLVWIVPGVSNGQPYAVLYPTTWGLPRPREAWFRYVWNGMLR